MKKNQEYYCFHRIYLHKTMKYTCKYIGVQRRRHTYQVVSCSPSSGFKIGDMFTPNEPEKYFDITNVSI